MNYKLFIPIKFCNRFEIIIKILYNLNVKNLTFVLKDGTFEKKYKIWEVDVGNIIFICGSNDRREYIY